jgi:hypothetical protein
MINISATFISANGCGFLNGEEPKETEKKSIVFLYI